MPINAKFEALLSQPWYEAEYHQRTKIWVGCEFIGNSLTWVCERETRDAAINAARNHEETAVSNHLKGK